MNARTSIENVHLYYQDQRYTVALRATGPPTPKSQRRCLHPTPRRRSEPPDLPYQDPGDGTPTRRQPRGRPPSPPRPRESLRQPGTGKSRSEPQSLLHRSPANGASTQRASPGQSSLRLYHESFSNTQAPASHHAQSHRTSCK